MFKMFKRKPPEKEKIEEPEKLTAVECFLVDKYLTQLETVDEPIDYVLTYGTVTSEIVYGIIAKYSNRTIFTNRYFHSKQPNVPLVEIKTLEKIYWLAKNVNEPMITILRSLRYNLDDWTISSESGRWRGDCCIFTVVCESNGVQIRVPSDDPEAGFTEEFIKDSWMTFGEALTLRDVINARLEREEYMRKMDKRKSIADEFNVDMGEEAV